MKKLKHFLVLIGVFSISAQAASIDCMDHYSAGLALMESGSYAEASAEFKEAIELDPDPRVGAIDYLPYVHLSVAAHKANRNHLAREALVKSQVYGVARDTEVGTSLLDQYAKTIMETELGEADEPLPKVYVSEFRELNQSNISLTPEQIAAIRSSVLKRCGLSSDLDENNLPWYFHYEFGIDLMNAGDATHSLKSLIMSANLREESKRRARMYGMRHVDYLPYYRIALAYATLGNWEGAYDAILASETFNEFSPDDKDYEDFSTLDYLVKSNMENSDS